MACPKCGGTSRTLIAPGFFRCTSKIIRRVTGPGLTDPRLGPQVLESSSECGREYQEGEAAGSHPRCHCGTYAIGECAHCGAPVCGDDSLRYAERRLCHACLAQAKQDAAQQAKLATERKNVVTEEALQVWRASVSNAVSALHPAAALCLRAKHFGPQKREFEYSASVIPDVPDSVVAKWFASVCRKPTNIDISNRRSQGWSFGRPRPDTTGWRWDNGSTAIHQSFSDTSVVTVDGRRGYSPRHWNAGSKGNPIHFWEVSFEPPGGDPEADRFNGRALSSMADMAGLENVLPPMPWELRYGLSDIPRDRQGELLKQ